MSFENIKGQDKAVEILKKGLLKGRIFSNYLFAGPDGVGKAMLAAEFAKAVNCRDEKRAPCDSCQSCRKIDSRNHPDVFFIEPRGASFSIGIDEIRAVCAKASLKPYEARKKIFIIDGAHSMKAQAANAFLKTLEEPPANTIFILISRSKSLLLPTIVSRCHIINFFAAPRELVERVVAEKFNLDGQKAKVLSNFSSGRIGEAIRMGENASLDRKNSLIDSLQGGKADFSARISDYSGREELKEDLSFLVAYFRDIFLYKATKLEAPIFNLDRMDEIKRNHASLTPEGLDFIIKEIIKLRSYVDYNVNPKIIIDVLSNELKRIYHA